MGDGWIKLHRKSREHWLYQKKPFDEWHAWEDLLLLVNHEQNKFLHGNKLETVERGQAITSLRQLGERWGWSKNKVKRFLELLISDAMLQIRWDTTKTVVTVENWDFYQSDNGKAGHERDTSGTRTETNKNEKNEKNKEIEGTKKFVPPSLDAVTAYCRERKNGIDPQRFIDFYQSKGWLVGKNKMKDWKSAVRTWESRNKADEASNGGSDYSDYVS